LATHSFDRQHGNAGLAVRGKLDLSQEKQGMCITCGSFSLEMILPIVQPTQLTVANRMIDHIILEIRAKGTTPIPGEHNITQYARLHNGLAGMPYLRFYEQHRPHIQKVHGGDTKAWPQTLQFAWLLRNGITHHGGHINFENPNYPAVTWNGLSFSPADNGKPIFAAHFTTADLIFLMRDVANHLDSIGAPFPVD